MTKGMRVAGVALLALLAVHPWLRPEGVWALLSACDLAAFTTACGLITRAHRVVATAFLFQLAVGLPALVIGMLTTYRWNASGIAIHLMPLVLGGIVVAARGLPPRAALYAWFGYAGSLVAATLFVPAQLNVNSSSQVWAPLGDVLSLRVYQGGLLLLVGALLAVGTRGLTRRSRMHPNTVRCS